MAKNVFPIDKNYIDKGGQPPHFETPEELWNKGMEYFESVTTTTGIVRGTISGLTRYCGFCSRSSWNDNEKRSPEFKRVIAHLKMIVAEGYERNLHGFNWAGSAFALRNIYAEDWKDEIIQQQHQIITTVQPRVIDTGTPLASSEEEIRP